MTETHHPDQRANLAAAVALSPDGVVLLDELGVVTYANPAFLAMVNLELDEIIGRPSDDLASPLIGSDLVLDLRDAVLANRLWRRAVDLRRPDGTPGSLEVTTIPIAEERSPKGYLVSVRDITLLRAAEARLERRRGLGRAVTEVARVLLHHTRADDISREACRALVQAGGGAMAWVGVLDRDTGRVVPIGSFGDTGYLASIDIAADLTAHGRGPAGQVLRTGEPVIVGDTESSAMMRPWRHALRMFGYRSVAVVPLRARGKLDGILVAYAAEPAAFSEDDTDLLAQLAADVAFALAIAEDTGRRKQLATSLRSSERRLAEALEDLSLAAVMLGSDATVQFANRHLLELTGWERAEVIGHDWFERFIPRDDREAGRAAYLEALARGTIIPNWKATLVTRSGEERQMEWSSAFARDEAGSIVGIVTVAYDITAREASRDALEASEARLRTALDAMLEGVATQTAIRDATGRITDFRIDYANSAIGIISGTAGSLQVGRTLLELFPAHRTNGLFDAYVRVVETGVPFESGTFHYVDPDAAGGPLDQVVEHRAAKMGDGYVFSVRDITDRHRAEREMRRLSAAVEQSSDAVVLTDASGAIEYVNPAFERATGYTAAEVLGQNPRILKSGVQGPAFYAAMWATLASGQPFTGELTNRRKDGSLFEEEAVISPIRDEAGAITSYVAVKRDVTERKRAEADRIRLEGSLAQAQKMESVGRLAGGVAHDFNNMLGAILGSAELALEALGPASPVRADLLEIQRAAQRSADLTRQLLAFARRQTVAPIVLDLNETLGGMLAMLRRLVPAGVELAWRPARDLWPVRADPSQIDQILANLVVNARDAIGDVGRITIETANGTLEPDYCAAHPGAVPGEYAVLTVSDDGCGMDAGTIAQIFEPFFTTKEAGKGTGLGLATVYGIVKQNGGFIDVASEVGAGSAFRVCLPRHKGRAATPKEPTHAVAGGGGETVLLVEDEPAILRLGTVMLERLGYRVVAAATPGEAIRLAREHAGEIHLLLTDVVMPEMNGRDLARSLLSIYPHMGQLYMSGYTADVIASRGVLEEGVHFLQKPFSADGLAAAVREALGRDPASADSSAG